MQRAKPTRPAQDNTAGPASKALTRISRQLPAARMVELSKLAVAIGVATTAATHASAAETASIARDESNIIFPKFSPPTLSDWMPWARMFAFATSAGRGSWPIWDTGCCQSLDLSV